MERTKALEKLNQEFELLKEDLKHQYYKAFEKNFEELVKKIYEKLPEVLRQKETQILQFQIRRIDLHNNVCNLEIVAYAHDWYLDQDRCQCMVAVDELWIPFRELIAKMEKNISIYMGSVSTYDLKNICIDYFLECFVDSSDLVREKFDEFDEWLLENKLSMVVPYSLVWGINKGENRTLFYQDVYEKDVKKLLERISDDEKKKKIAHFFVSSCKSNLEDEKIEKQAFLHSCFKESRFKNITFNHCTFGRTTFKKSKFEWSGFGGNRMVGCNFRNIDAYQLDFGDADFDLVTFENSELHRVCFEDAKLSRAVFDGSNLKYVSFKNAKLDGVSFRGANLEEIDFTGAEFSNVYVNVKDVARLKLTEEQRENMFVLEEDLNEVL